MVTELQALLGPVSEWDLGPALVSAPDTVLDSGLELGRALVPESDSEQVWV
jgi:hypothetical protein